MTTMQHPHAPWSYVTKANRFRALTLALLEHEAERALAEDYRPDDITVGAFDDIQAYTELVRSHMAEALWAIRRPVRTRRGMRRAGLLELNRLRRHEAFGRRKLCATCQEKKAIACTHPTEMQRWLQKAAVAMTKDPRHTWALAFFVLVARDMIDHFRRFQPLTTDGTDAHENGDHRVWEGARREEVAVRTVEWKENDAGEYEDWHSHGELVRTTDSPGRSPLDLQGWDRPSSYPTKTTRMAFCPTCADLIEHAKARRLGRQPAEAGVPIPKTPWFRVRKRKTADGYERAPYAHTQHCPVCNQLEGTPHAPTSTPIYIHRRSRRVGRQVVPVYTVFYRNARGWHDARTHTRCHVTLANEIEKRWRLR